MVTHHGPEHPAFGVGERSPEGRGINRQNAKTPEDPDPPEPHGMGNHTAEGEEIWGSRGRRGCKSSMAQSAMVVRRKRRGWATPRLDVSMTRQSRVRDVQTPTCAAIRRPFGELLPRARTPIPSSLLFWRF